MLDTKRLIKSLESCKTKSEFDFESRKSNLPNSEYKNFCYSASELKDVELNQLLSEFAYKFEKYVNLFETVKNKFCDKTNPLNESENDCDDDDDMGPEDNVSLIAASSTSVTSSKSSIVKQIKLKPRCSELQVLEELARSRKAKVEAEAKAAEAKVEAEAEAAAAAALAAAAAAAAEEETLAKLR